jgi:hypothetical protein
MGSIFLKKREKEKHNKEFHLFVSEARRMSNGGISLIFDILRNFSKIFKIQEFFKLK